MIAVIDYGVGNLFSLTASLREIGAEAIVTNKAEDLKAADKIILPGVGAFEDAINKLRATGLVSTIDEEVAAGKPMMGICLGMQLLFEKSYEYGEFDGLGYIKGKVISMRDAEDPAKRVRPETKVPQIGWNALHFVKDDPRRASKTVTMCISSTDTTRTIAPSRWSLIPTTMSTCRPSFAKGTCAGRSSTRKRAARSVSRYSRASRSENDGSGQG